MSNFDESSLEEILANLTEQNKQQEAALKEVVSFLAKKKNKTPPTSVSPLRVKKVKLQMDSNTGLPTQITGPSTSRSNTGTELGNVSDTGVHPDSVNPSPLPPTDSDSDDISVLENEIINNLESDIHDEQNAKSADGEDSNDSDDLGIIGDDESDSWSLSPKIISWLQKILDKSIPDSTLKQINEQYSPSAEIKDLFSPAKFPDSLWQSIKSSNDAIKLKILHSSQTKMLNSLKPLLSALETCQDPDTKSNLTTGIQMLTSVNLDLNRFRRILAAPHLKHEYKSSFLKLPVTHSSLFGEDFEKSSDKVIKEHNAISKVIKPKPKKFFSNQSQSNQPPFRANPPRGGNFRSQRGGRGGGRGGYRGRGRGSNSGNSSGTFPSLSQSQSSSSSQQ